MNDVTVFPTGKYELLQDANISRVPGGEDERLPAGTEITYGGRPGRHMKPLDADASLAFALAGLNPPVPGAVVLGNPVAPPGGMGEDEDTRMVRVMAEAMGKAFAAALPMAVAAVMDEMEKRGIVQPKAVMPAPVLAPPPDVPAKPGKPLAVPPAS